MLNVTPKKTFCDSIHIENPMSLSGRQASIGPRADLRVLPKRRGG
jgi:hypothetical protein